MSGLPEIDYPVPLVVKNTFIHAVIGRPLSLEGFYLEREIHSTPVSAIEGAAAVAEVSFEPAFVAKESLGRSAEPDGSSSCRGTSVGSSSARSGADESPGSQSEVSSSGRVLCEEHLHRHRPRALTLD